MYLWPDWTGGLFHPTTARALWTFYSFYAQQYDIVIWTHNLIHIHICRLDPALSSLVYCGRSFGRPEDLMTYTAFFLYRFSTVALLLHHVMVVWWPLSDRTHAALLEETSFLVRWALVGWVKTSVKSILVCERGDCNSVSFCFLFFTCFTCRHRTDRPPRA